MGAQTPIDNNKDKESFTEIQFDNYDVQLRVVSSSEVDLAIVDSKTFYTYERVAYVFQTQIAAATLIAALNRKSEGSLRAVLLPGKDDENKPVLKLSIRVSFDFIPPFEETIILNQKLNQTESEITNLRIKHVNNEIVRLSEQMNFKSEIGKRYVFVIPQGNYSSANETVTRFQLPKGKYEISVSFYTTSSQTWIYMKLNYNGSDLLSLQEGGFYYTIGNNVYQPLTLRCKATISEDFGHIQMDSQACNSYPWTMKNMIISAQSI